jgi:hypothetical protein
MKANPQKDRDISLAQMEAGLTTMLSIRRPVAGLGYERVDDEKVGGDANKYFAIAVRRL